MEAYHFWAIRQKTLGARTSSSAAWTKRRAAGLPSADEGVRAPRGRTYRFARNLMRKVVFCSTFARSNTSGKYRSCAQSSNKSR
jgi:hypothetical protein